MRHGFAETQWSTGRRNNIEKGDAVFMLRVGVEPKGLIGSGRVIRASFLDNDWKDESPVTKKTNYVKVRWDHFIDADLNPDDVLPTDKIPGFPNNPQAGGILLSEVTSEAIAEQLNLLRQNKKVKLFDPGTTGQNDEKTRPGGKYYEGDRRDVMLQITERDTTARLRCLEHYGFTCQVCDFDFEATYGEIGQDFIHVHHIELLANKTGRHEVDPLNDLIPVCPNCHGMLHTSSPPLTVKQLRFIIEKQKSNIRAMKVRS
jgi:5-methylcytosine-specific restriction protein A